MDKSSCSECPWTSFPLSQNARQLLKPLFIYKTSFPTAVMDLIFFLKELYVEKRT